MNTKQLRQKILDLAIRGKLVPQDPNDEPAEVLLERINIEKERLIKEGKIKRDKTVKIVDTSHYEELPYGWVICTVNDISSFVQFGLSNSAETSGNYKFLRITDIQDNHVNWNSVPFTNITEEEAEVYLLKNDDIVFARTGATVGKSYLITELEEYSVFASYLIRVKILCAFPKYVKYYFESADYWEQITDKSVGIGQPNVNGTKLKEISLPLPPLAEQHRIVAAIESAFTVIDEIERNKTDLQAVVATAKQKILSLAIQGKLVPQDPNDEPADVLLENIRTEREALIRIGKVRRDKNISSNTNFDNEIDFSNLPDSWVVCTLGELAQYKKGPFGSSITKAMFVPDSDSTVKVYEQKNAIQKDASLGNYFITQDKFEELKGFEVFERDIIVSCAGTIGETYVMPQGIRQGIINQALMKVSLYEKDITNFYLIYFDYVLKELAQKESKGTAIKNIPPFEILKQFPFPLPPLAEQKRIVAAIEAAFEELDEIMIMLK